MTLEHSTEAAPADVQALEVSSTQTHAEPQADRTADGLFAGQAALVTGQAHEHSSTAPITAHALTQHDPRAHGGRVRDSRVYARVDRHMGYGHPGPDSQP